MSRSTDVWLVRHGEVESYRGDLGLTERGRAQAATAGAALAAQLGAQDDVVALRHAGSVRAQETARLLGETLRDAGVAIGAPALDAGFDNFNVLVEGRVQPHDAMRVAIYAARERPGWPPAHKADWEHEADRFATIHDGGGDPIAWWLTQPTLAYEPAARVVRRFWRALARLAGEGAARVVVGTHSGPIRAIAAHAFGEDPGEPDHCEHVRVRVGGAAAGAPAELTYRGRTAALAIPRTEEPAWP